jgi:hypothetical protein
MAVCYLQPLARGRAGLRVVPAAGVPELPALLFNQPGIDFASWLAWLDRWRHDSSSSSRPGFAAARPSPDTVRKQPWHTWKWPAPQTAPSTYDGGWVEMFDYAPMAGSVTGCLAHSAAAPEPATLIRPRSASSSGLSGSQACLPDRSVQARHD